MGRSQLVVGHSLVLGLSLGATLGAAPLRAEPPQPFVVQAVPPTGAVDVPTNAYVLVRPDDLTPIPGDAPLQIRVVGAGETFATFAGTGALQQLTPLALTPDTAWDVVADRGAEPRLLTSFTTGAGPDDVAPAAPQVSFRSTGDEGDNAVYAHLQVTTDAVDPVDVVDVVEISIGGGTPYLDDLEPGGDIFPSTLHGTRDVVIVAIDRGGNRSPPTTLRVDFCLRSASQLISSDPVVLCPGVAAPPPEGEGEGEGEAAGEGEGEAASEGEGEAAGEGEGEAADEGEGEAADEGEGEGDVDDDGCSQARSSSPSFALFGLLALLLRRR